MAREEADREDLLEEATALVERAEVRPPPEVWPEPVVIGFRGDGSLSCFLGSETVYHFNRLFQLRRAYLDGKLLKADRGRLAALRRQRTEGAVHLLRHDLDAEQTGRLLERMRRQLDSLADALADGQAEIVRQVPPAEMPRGAGLRERMAAEMKTAALLREVAASPRLR